MVSKQLLLPHKSLKKICIAYQLGSPIKKPRKLSGGLLHRLWQIETNTGAYVIKKLNPNIIKNLEIAVRYRKTELIAEKLKQHRIPAVSALLQQGDPLYQVGAEIFMVFPYISGSFLKLDNVKNIHAKQIAILIAKIHQADIAIDSAPKAEYYALTLLDWENLHAKVVKYNAKVANLLKKNLPAIELITHKNTQAKLALNKNLIISHRDCDPKNVLWKSLNQPFIIDWESAGLINKTKDLITTAIYWSIDTKHDIDLKRFKLFLRTYLTQEMAITHNEIEPAIYSLLGDWLIWVKFNLERLIDDSADPSERKLGAYEANNTLLAIPKLLQQIISSLKDRGQL